MNGNSLPIAQRNALLIHEKDGQVVETAMPEAEGRALFEQLNADGQGASLIVLDAFFDVVTDRQILKSLPARIHEAKVNLQRTLDWRKVMDRNGVPGDNTVRASVIRTIREIMDQAQPKIAAGDPHMAFSLH
ncbi:hypothetical protein [Paraburkholderia sp. J8-2]|uniref:hypothetical protein n=1 Tax=Paraburkholderia sp. J8-2 TaxID=2805440 RepID=UPI002AB793E3|nr:hypothetical protein [Paraburkholderia sp. J8-2]